MLSALSAHETPQSSSVASLIQHLGASSGVAIRVALLLAAIANAVSWVQARRKSDEAYLFCGCVLASLAASPIVWSHYFALLVLIPLTLRWQLRSQVIAWGVSWIVFAPGGAPVLAVLHPFPGASWILGSVVAGAAFIWHRRRQPTNERPMEPSAASIKGER
jgi:hypothetical protein